MFNILYDSFKLLESYYTKKIFNIRNDKSKRNVIKINELESIKEQAQDYDLPIVVKLAENAMTRIINGRK